MRRRDAAIEAFERFLALRPESEEAALKVQQLRAMNGTALDANKLCQLMLKTEQSAPETQDPLDKQQERLYRPYQPAKLSASQTCENDSALFQDIDGLIAQAVADYEKGGREEALQTRVERLFRMDRFEECLRLLERAGDGADAQVMRAKCYFRLKNYAQCVKLLLRAQTVDHEVLEMLAESYVNLGAPGKAQRCADELLALDAHDPRAHYQKALALKAQGQFVQAIVYASQAHKLAKTDEDRLRCAKLRAYCYSQNKQLQLALQDYNAIIRQHPTGEDLFNRAIIYQQLNRISEATDDLIQALKLEPESVEIAQQLALNCSALGRFSDGIRVIRGLKAHDDPALQPVYAQLLKNDKQFDEAAAVF